jgi:hypothetical protein
MGLAYEVDESRLQLASNFVPLDLKTAGATT